MQTLLLDVSKWDLVLDVAGNIAVASDPYSLAQDAASAIKLFDGELFYDTTKGVPYWADVLGKPPSFALIRAKLIAAAMTVPGVVAARCFISSFKDRVVTGQVQIYDALGTIISTAGF
jgi:hypothetical protein